MVGSETLASAASAFWSIPRRARAARNCPEVIIEAQLPPEVRFSPDILMFQTSVMGLIP
jgi:hypothetical protein